jgi:hypothetical protein
MPFPFFSLVALLSLAAPDPAGGRLLVAGADGGVYRADPSTNAFAYFTCACTGPVSALAADGENLYVADELGQLLVADVNTGAPKSLVQVRAGRITALAASGAGLFAGSRGGVVTRVDPETGATLGRRAVPATGSLLPGSSGRFAPRRGPSPVSALAVLGEHLIAATADGAVLRAPLDSGPFTLLGRFCFPGLAELIVDGDDLVGGFGPGFVIRLDGASGRFLSSQWLGPMDALALSAGDFLVHGQDGLIERFDAVTSASLGTLEAPFDVRAMLVVADP